jgi:glucans biosynthesis protein C
MGNEEAFHFGHCRRGAGGDSDLPYPLTWIAGRRPTTNGHEVSPDTSVSLQAPPVQAQVRRPELDWLRAFVVFGLIPFHVAVMFIGSQGDYVRNAQSSWVLSRLVAFISFWGIPLLFFISGAATRYALNARTNQQYVKERITRLAIPFVFAMLTIMPAQVYIGYLGTPALHVSFWRYYGQFMRSLLDILHGVMPARGADWIGHLWFIPPLLAVSLVALPLFRFFRRDRGKRFITSIDASATGPWALLTLGLPLGLCEVVLRAGWSMPGSNAPQAFDNWPGFILFGLFYIGGYIVHDAARIQQDLRRWWALALALGVVTWLLVEGVGAFPPLVPRGTLRFEALVRLLRGYVSWFWVAAIVGFGMRYLVSTGTVVRYLSDATFPIYVLHMPILTLIGFYVVRWPVGIAVKFVVITVAALAVTVAVVELLVRHVAPIRFLFGMSVRPRHETAPTPALVELVRPSKRRSPTTVWKRWTSRRVTAL